ncbi:hypothetical protein [Thermoactinospora rubra]|uniref:hypothetical protein n=1 Tax=Thermoactinospora rubra TaxID=1088767 RepID=UPI001301DE7F|nr:hypothetical protein [Thermoactinospora rubra]
MIKDWEAGRHQPKDPYRLLLCRVFDASEAELFQTPQDAPAADPDEVLARLLGDGERLTPHVSRGGRRLGKSAAADLSARVHGLRLADDVIAGKDLIRPAFRELDNAVRLYRGSSFTAEMGRGLLVGIGELAQIAGWIAGDAGAHEQAARTYRLGIGAARTERPSAHRCHALRA